MKPTRIRSIAPADKEDRGGRSGLLPTVDPNRMFGMVPELNHPVCLASLLSCDWQDALTPTTSSTSRSSQTPPPPDSTSTEFTSKSTGSSSVLTNPTVDGGEDIAEPEMLCPSLQPLGILGLDSRYDWLCARLKRGLT
ncbi:hypothetical protein EST38_g9894 [Candolleomyces aberdarensis]|uniref:Uncharacterized protein n=1 Tax=Candolleomyces aberdarensis TaxID=2316362 RepID=A0A4Q2DB70_9AGAR|nr:hypothetical protein EST38_g9894 [Candolleomyces aberdarensis]